MNWKAWLPLAVAIVLGLIAARVAMNVVGSGHTEAGPSNMVPVVVATRDIEAGTTLTGEDVKIGHVDAASAPVGGFSSPAEVANRVTKMPLGTNQAILGSTLADEGAGFGVGATLPAGMRAITVAIDEVSGVAGFITPQSKVDVVTTVQVEGKQTAKTLLERIQVIAVGARTNPATPATEPARNVTLLVTPEQAEQIELATVAGRVRLLLRNGKDESNVASDGTTLSEIRDGRQSNELTANGAAKAVPVGMRAITVAIDDVTGVNGFIQPNSQIDIVGTIKGSKEVSRAILEKVTVLAIGSRTSVRSDAEAGKTATLLVTPEQAEKLAMLINSGTIRLSLRNGTDEATINSNGVTVADLTGAGSTNFSGDPFTSEQGGIFTAGSGPTTMPTQAPTYNKARWTVEIIKAGQTSTQTMDIPQETPVKPAPKAAGTAVSGTGTN